VADVDGTLTEQGAPVPQTLVTLISRYREKGGRFTLATGRCVEAARPFLSQLEVDSPAILLNGAMLFDPVSERTLEEHHLDSQLVEHLLTRLEQTRPDALVYRDQEVFVRRITPAIKRHLIKDKSHCREVTHWLELDRRKVFKVLVIAPEAPVSLFGGRWVNSEPTYWEILPDGVSKGAALASLCRRLHISPEEVAAVGDGLNDLEMISFAGLGVALANAAAGLKPAAAMVTVSPGSLGVCELVEQLLATR